GRYGRRSVWKRRDRRGREVQTRLVRQPLRAPLAGNPTAAPRIAKELVKRPRPHIDFSKPADRLIVVLTVGVPPERQRVCPGGDERRAGYPPATSKSARPS